MRQTLVTQLAPGSLPHAEPDPGDRCFQVFPRIAMFELAADHHLGVRRFNLRPPAGRDRRAAVHAFIREWDNVLWVEKCRQYEASRRDHALPPLPAAWGPVLSPSDMPCVVWLVLPKPGK